MVDRLSSITHNALCDFHVASEPSSVEPCRLGRTQSKCSWNPFYNNRESPPTGSTQRTKDSTPATMRCLQTWTNRRCNSIRRCDSSKFEKVYLLYAHGYPACVHLLSRNCIKLSIRCQDSTLTAVNLIPRCENLLLSIDVTYKLITIERYRWHFPLYPQNKHGSKQTGIFVSSFESLASQVLPHRLHEG